MRKALILPICYVFAYFIIFIALYLLVDDSIFSGWMWPSLLTGFSLMMFIFLIILEPRLLPRRFFATKYSTSQSFETRSWPGSILPVLAIGGFLVPFGVSMLIDSSAVLPSRSPSSVLAVLAFASVSLLYPMLLLLQIMGDGASGIRIYPDRVELRKIGQYGWRFNKDDIKEIEVLDDIFPLVAVKGKGTRIDRLFGSIMPDSAKASIDGAILAGISGKEIYETLGSFGYDEMLVFNSSKNESRYSRINL